MNARVLYQRVYTRSYGRIRVAYNHMYAQILVEGSRGIRAAFAIWKRMDAVVLTESMVKNFATIVFNVTNLTHTRARQRTNLQVVKFDEWEKKRDKWFSISCIQIDLKTIILWLGHCVNDKEILHSTVQRFRREFRDISSLHYAGDKNTDKTEE